MNLFQLAETFVTIANVGSIQAAAVALGQTDAAISKKLKRLEAHLGLQLLLRKRSGMVLTEAGQRYYHEAKKALEQFILAEQVILQNKVHVTGKLCVVANQYYCQHWIMPKLAGFLKRYPQIEFSLSMAEVQPDFNVKKMDILLGVSTLGEENLVRKKIDQTRYVLCATPAYLKKRGVPQNIHDLLQHDFIAHSVRKSSHQLRFDAEQSLVLKPKLSVDNSSMMIEACLSDIGFIRVHEHMVADYIKKKKLVVFLPGYTKEIVPIYVYYPYQEYANPCISTFMRYFFES